MPCINVNPLHGKKRCDEKRRERERERKTKRVDRNKKREKERRTAGELWRIARSYVERETVYTLGSQTAFSFAYARASYLARYRTSERATLDPGNKRTDDGRRPGCTRNTENK